MIMMGSAKLVVLVAVMGVLAPDRGDGAPSVPAMVLETLKVPRTGDGVPAAIRQFQQMQKVCPAGVLAREAWRDLAMTIIGGTQPDALWTRIVDNASVTQTCLSMNFSCPEFGTWELRHKMTKGLWEAAIGYLDAGDREGANACARAAFTMSAVDYCDLGPGAMTEYLRDPRAKELLNVSERVVAEMMSAVRADSGTTVEFLGALEPAAKSLDAFIASAPKEAPREEAIRSFLNDLRLAYERAPTAPPRRWKLANMLWRFCCVARAHGHQNMLTAAHEFVAAMKNEPFAQTLDAKWLDEALIAPGPMPRSAGVGVISGPNDIKPRRR